MELRTCGCCVISIHALREEGDTINSLLVNGQEIFLSTPSARRATWSHSIRPPLPRDFYPRPPRGGRRRRCCTGRNARTISIHALREEGDLPAPSTKLLVVVFLSTPSARRATSPRWFSEGDGCISIHALREEGDSIPEAGADLVDISIHALCEEGDAKTTEAAEAKEYFYPRPLRGGRRDTPSKMFSFSFSFLSTPSARRATAKTETKSLFSNKLYNILHEFRRALIYNGSKNDPNHAK